MLQAAHMQAQSGLTAWQPPVTARPSGIVSVSGGHSLASNQPSAKGAQSSRKAPATQRILTTANGTEIWGSLISTSGSQQEGSFEGIYSFTSSAADGSSTPINISPDLIVNGGYAYKQSYTKENYLYYITYGVQNGSVSAHYYIYSADTWNKNSYEEEVSDPGKIALDVDLDKASGESYGCFYNNDGNGYEWAKMNYSTFDDKTTIKALTKALFAVAINADGEAYAIDADGTLVKVDKATGDQTVIGSTGLRPNYLQSMAFDPQSGKLYWAATLMDGTSSLYEVSTETGAATLIKHFPNNEEYTALYIPVPAADGAPAKVTDMTTNFPDGGLEGNISFTAPTTTVDGSALPSEALNYYIVGESYWGLDTVARGTVQPGAVVTQPFSYSLSGQETYIIMTRNAAGFSPKSTLKFYVGHDTPAQPQNISLTYDKQSQKATLTWDAPTTGAHKGYVDPSNMTYTVVRYPDGTTVQSSSANRSYTEQITDTLGKEFYYGVSATYDFKTGAEGQSNHLKFASEEDTVAAKIPQAPRDVVLTEEDNDVFRLSWSAPANVSDPSTLTYYIYQVSEDGRQTLADSLVNGATTWTTTFSESLEQNFVYYRVSAKNSYGTGPDARSNIAVYGKPYSLPYHESVNGGGMETWVWSADAGDASFGVSSDAQDNDAGAFSAALLNGQTASMTSPKITLSGATRPELSVWTKLSKATLTPVVTAYGQAPRELQAITSADGEWKQSIFDLSEFTGAKYLRISFRATATADSASAAIDDIDIIDVLDYDMAVEGISVPANVQAGHKLKVAVTLRNIGNTTVTPSDYSIDLYVNRKVADGVAAVALPELKSMQTGVAELTYDVPAVGAPESMNVYAKISYANDLDDSNNTSEVKGVGITASTLPAVSGLTSTTQSGSTTLSWTAPEIGDQLAVTDDFESYEHWTTTNLDPWTALDVDKGKSYDISIDGTELHFPHATEAFGFLAFDYADYSQFPTMAAHSGTQYLAAFCPSTYYAPQANDWLISPELSGKQQTVSLWARSYLASGDYSFPETFEILYSTTDTARASFTRATGGLFQNIPDTWTEYSAELPEGAKYFAIHYTSIDKFAAFFDDVTYSVAAPQITGYIIYRDGEAVDTVAAGTTTWTGTTPSAGSSYQVVVEYDNGYSAPVSAADVTAIVAPAIDAQPSESNRNAAAYNLAGQRVSPAYKGVVIRNGRKVIVK